MYSSFQVSSSGRSSAARRAIPGGAWRRGGHVIELLRPHVDALDDALLDGVEIIVTLCRTP
jgi:hypothetical protein